MDQLKYGKQVIDNKDVDAVVEALKSEYLTTGPLVKKFERKLADYCAVPYATAVNSGTAALHCAMFAIGIKPGDEVIVPAISFAATANCVEYMGATPIFCDVNVVDLEMRDYYVEPLITEKTKAVISVDYSGIPVRYQEIGELCDKHNLYFVSDACHSLGAIYRGHKVGSLADITCFSFHPVKNITTAEGGACTTNNVNFDARMKSFRNHGITALENRKDYDYDMTDLGYNYRMNELQAALGISQLDKLDEFVEKRQQLSDHYDKILAGEPFEPITRMYYSSNLRKPARHIYVVKIEKEGADLKKIYHSMKDKGINVNVHYKPIHQLTYYKNKYPNVSCPSAEEAKLLTLPLHVDMTTNDVERVLEALYASL